MRQGSSPKLAQEPVVRNPKQELGGIEGFIVVGRAVKQGTCGIFAFPSFRHDCHRERSGLPTTPYAVVATGALLFGASPTLTDSGVTSPMVDC